MSSENFEPTYLYLKQHNVTGLLYFGKLRATSKLCQNIGIEKYLGSGTYWTSHLATHGKDITTLWYCLFTNKEELCEFAVMNSEIMDVVLKKKNKKKVFANLIPENGLSGTPKGLEISEERRQKQQETHWARKLTKEENPNFGQKRSEQQATKYACCAKRKSLVERVCWVDDREASY